MFLVAQNREYYPRIILMNRYRLSADMMNPLNCLGGGYHTLTQESRFFIAFLPWLRVLQECCASDGACFGFMSLY
jgi:hypothetical protein